MNLIPNPFFIQNEFSTCEMFSYFVFIENSLTKQYIPKFPTPVGIFFTLFISLVYKKYQVPYLIQLLQLYFPKKYLAGDLSNPERPKFLDLVSSQSFFILLLKKVVLFFFFVMEVKHFSRFIYYFCSLFGYQNTGRFIFTKDSIFKNWLIFYRLFLCLYFLCLYFLNFCVYTS